ncbi:MAG: aldo/keto reductase [Verrucomicrobiota bacterium]
MQNTKITRRDLIKGTIGAGILLAGSQMAQAIGLIEKSTGKTGYDAKGLPTAILGKTGVRIPRIAVGLGSRFCNMEKDEEAIQILNHALDNGLYYWDTACDYENKKLGFTSEGRIGEVLKTRRKEVFICTKVDSRDPEEAKRQIERSLKRLQTDHLDILKIHDVKSAEDVAKVSEKGNLIDIAHQMKEQGVARHIGFSGHANADALKSMAERGDFDTMLMAMNHYNQSKNPQPRQALVLPAAKAKGLGVMIMKTVRPRETIKTLDPKELVRYALSLSGPDGIVLGMDSVAVMDANLEILRNFKPLDEQRMKELALNLTPFYQHENLPWMKYGYCDGKWA